MNKKKNILFVFLLLIACGSIVFCVYYFKTHSKEYIYNKYNQSYFDNLYDYNCVSTDGIIKPNYHVPSFIDVVYDDNLLEINNDSIKIKDDSFDYTLVSYFYNEKKLGVLEFWRLYDYNLLEQKDDWKIFSQNKMYLLVNKEVEFYAISDFCTCNNSKLCNLHYSDEDFYLEYNDDEFVVNKADNCCYNIKALKTGNNVIKVHIGKDAIYEYTFYVFNNKELKELDDWYINNCIIDPRNCDTISRMYDVFWGIRWYNITGPTYVDELGNTYILQYDEENNRTVGILCQYLSYDDIINMRKDGKFEYYYNGELKISDLPLYAQCIDLNSYNYDVSYVFELQNDYEKQAKWFAIPDVFYSIEELSN